MFRRIEMDPHRNDKFKHTEPEFHNTKDAFGNQLNVGDEVYYFKRHGKNIRFGRGVVTHFTKLKIAVKGEHASVDPGTACDPACVAKIFAAKDN